ncbi:MAG: Ig-like domain-containing protein, partial [Thiopseudomonas sp.]|nr:Ig-like domain-containing protein [Thiopseudomonas sp.]
TQYGSKTLFFGEPVEAIVHPWNLVNNHGTGANERNLTAVNAADNQFIIETAADLRNLSLSDVNVAADVANNLSGNALADLQTTYWTATNHFIQSKDIGAVIFDNPIGDTTAFTGTYNGQNYTVSSLNVTANANNTGMFGLFTGAFVKNLNISALTLTGASVNTGALAGSINSVAAIDNINLNNVDVSLITAGTNVAGLIGVTGAGAVTVNDVTVKFASNAGISGVSAAGLIGTAGAATSIANANVTTQGTGAITGTKYASGLVGLFNGTTIDNANVTLSAALSATGAGSFVGGIAADAAGANITNSSVTFAETVSAALATSKVGGIAGNVSGASTLSSNKVTAAKLISAAAATSYAGGIVGYAADTTVNVTNNSFISAVVSPDHAVSALSGAAAGCVAGNETGHADSLYNKNSITSTTIADAIAYPITGNTCNCPQHTHPINTKSNDFMAGKNHTLPRVTVTAITHSAHAVPALAPVATFPAIILHFDKPINTATLQTAFTLTEHTYGVDGNPTDTESAVVIDGDQFTYNWEDDNQRVTVTPLNALRYNTRYTAKIVKDSLKDIFGNILQAATTDVRGYNAANSGAANVEWSFTTIKGNEPKISDLIVTRDRRTVTVKFSATNYDGSVIDTTGVKAGVYYVKQAGEPTKPLTTELLTLADGAGHNSVKVDIAQNGLAQVTLTYENIVTPNERYHLYGFITTADSNTYYSAASELVVHPWNIEADDTVAGITLNNNTLTSEMLTNRFVIEKEDNTNFFDLSNLTLANSRLTRASLNGIPTSATDLAVNTAYKNAYWSCNYVQTADINLLALGDWLSPIGLSVSNFIGTYNGQNYSIKNISFTTAVTSSTGLFGEIRGASLSNIVLDTATVGAVNADNVGLLVGRASSPAGETTTISNVKIAGTSSVTAKGNVGGIIGSLAKGSVTDSEILTGLTLTGTANYIGGVVGYTAAGTEIKNNKFGGAFAAGVTSSDLISGCVAGNETANLASKGSANFTTQSAVGGNALDFVISGNICTGDAHGDLGHPVNDKSNDFMAGKYNTKPQLTTISPAHRVSVGSAVIGDISIYTPIVLTFDKPMDKAAVEGAFSVYRHDDDGALTQTTASFTATDFDFSWTQDSQTVTATVKAAKASFEYNRAYTVKLVVNAGTSPAFDIYSNIVSGARGFSEGTTIGKDGAGENTIEWSFKTGRGDKPEISPITFVRDRRIVEAQFSANVMLNGVDITASATKYVGIYYSLDVADVNPKNDATGLGDKLHNPTDLVTTPVTGHNHVIGSANYSTGQITCTLNELNLTDVNTPYYLVPYVITTDGFIHFGVQHKVVVHPWNLRDANNTATELAKVSSELTSNAFIIETAADLTNLSLSDINAIALKGDGTLYSTLAELKGYYWTQACNFIQIANIADPVTFVNPIGDTTAFTGTYNGQNYTVSSLAVTGNANYAGMFGLFTGASVKNLNVSALTLNKGTLTAAGVSGALIASVNAAATIDNINLNDVDVSAITGAANSAGLIGVTGAGAVTVNNVSVTFKANEGISGTSAAGLIGTAGAATSIANANVTTQGTGAITGVTYASGLVGLFNGTAINNANVTLSAALSTTGENSFVGGIAGNAIAANITDSNVTFAETVSVADAGSKVGGIAGNVSGASALTSNKVTAAKLISAAAATSYAGGIVGYAADTTVNVLNNSFISAVVSPDHAVSALSGAAAGCVAGNETGHADSL